MEKKKPTRKQKTKKPEKVQFTYEDIEDVQINLRINGKTYLFLPKKGEDREELFKMRMALIMQIADSHVVYPIAIEDQIAKIEVDKTEE
jgi:hypothetical protein